MRTSNRKLLATLAVAALLGGQSIAVNAMAGLSNGIIFANNGSTFNSTGTTSANGIDVESNGTVNIGSLDDSQGTTFRNSFIRVSGNGTFTTGGGVILPGAWDFAPPSKPIGATRLAYVTGGTANIGYNTDGSITNNEMHLEGDVIVGEVGGANTNKSVINIALTHPESNWIGLAFNNAGDNGEINLTLNNGGNWDAMYNGGSQEIIDNGSRTPSRINRLVGTANRDNTTMVIQSEHNPIYINELQGHMNFFVSHNDDSAYVDEADTTPLRPDQMTDGQKPSDFWGGNIYIKSATPGSVAHVVTTPDGIDINDENKVNTALNNLAGKVFYTNFVNGERNLTGTVALASAGADSSSFKIVTDGKAHEGAITWQADKNGQGKYGSDTTPQPEQPTNPVTPTNPTTPVTPTQPTTPVTPTNPTTPVTPQPEQPTTPTTPVQPTNPGDANNNGNNANNNSGIQRGDYDTPHMRGARSAIMSNIGAWRTLTDDMYRTRALQQGAETGIWAHIGTGRYEFTNTGINNDSDYTRFQGGFDKKFGSLIVGGQIDYLRGSDDFNVLGASRTGSGKERAYAGGLYATKSFANNTYVQLEAKAGRVSNEFTVYNEIGSGLSGKTSATGYSVSARVGKQVKFSNGVYVEPQAQLSYMHLGGDNFNAGSMNVNQSGVNSTAGKLGFEVGKTFGAGSIYTRFDVGHAFTGNVKTTYTSGSTVKTTETDIKGTWTEIAFGGRYGIGTNNSIYADITKGLTGDYKQKWGVNAGFSHKF